MKKFFIIALLILCLAIPAMAAEELKDYLFKGMPDYVIGNQTRNFERLTVNSTEPGSKKIEKVTYEGNLVYSRYNYKGNEKSRPSSLQVKRYHQSAAKKLGGGETLWEDDNNLHASFERNGKQYYMVVKPGSGAVGYELWIIEVAELNYDVEIIDDAAADGQQDYIFKGMPDYVIGNQTRNFERLTVNSTEPESKKTEKTTYEGNLAYSRYNYKGNEVTRPSPLQIKRYFKSGADKLGGEVLWEDGYNLHASFNHNEKQYYMSVKAGSGAVGYELWILEVGDQEYDVDILDDDEDIKKEDEAKEEEEAIEIRVDEVPGGKEETDGGSIVDKLKNLIKKNP